MRPLLVLGALLLAACSPQPAVETGTVPDLDGAFDFGALTIVNDAGESLEFDVYIGTTREQQLRGLMFIREMPASTRMLFVYDTSDYRSIWMKNTYIPLDLVFARDDGSVSSIVADATPLTLDSRLSIEPVRYVLELNGGTARRLGIGKDSRLVVEAL